MATRPAPNPTLAKAVEYHKAGQFSRALKNYTRVLKQDPGHRDALVLGGQAAFQAGQQQQGLRWLKLAVEKHPDDPDASYNLGVMYQALGETYNALEAFSRAAAVGPDFAPAHYNLAMTLFELGRSEEAVPSFDNAIAAKPDYAEAFAGKGFVLRGLQKFDEAIRSYHEAVRIDPDNAKSWAGLGICLQEADKPEEALEAHQTAVRLAPDYPEATSNVSDTLVQLGRTQEAIEACDRFLQRRPADAGVLASKCIALNETGGSDDLAELLDLEKLVMPVQLDPPPTFTNMDAFNAALGKHILNHPTLVVSPSSHATKKGKHTGSINTGNKGPVSAFEELIRRGVETYVQSFAGSQTHPVIRYRPQNYSMNVWAVVLEGEGYQLPHIHPSAWLSGVYYARVPEIANKGGHDGWIEFGQPGPEYHFSAEPRLRLVKPEPGLMVLFPSYMFHRTVPFESDETRISVAFDVLAA